MVPSEGFIRSCSLEAAIADIAGNTDRPFLLIEVRKANPNLSIPLASAIGEPAAAEIERRGIAMRCYPSDADVHDAIERLTDLIEQLRDPTAIAVRVTIVSPYSRIDDVIRIGADLFTF